MTIIGSGVLEAGKENAAYFSYPLQRSKTDRVIYKWNQNR